MATNPVSEFDDLLAEVRDDARGLIAEIRPFFDPDIAGRKLASVLKAMTHEELVKHLRGCGHDFDGPCNCDGCSTLGRMFLGGS